VATRIDRLLAGPGFAFPDLGVPTEEHVFETTYFDTPDRVLGRADIVLARRVEGGRSVWQLSLPAHELEAASGARPPSAITGALAAALAGGASLEPVARLRTRRRSVVVQDEGGATARIVDDVNSVLNGDQTKESFRELQVAPLNGGAEARKVVKRIRAAGATSASHSELERILSGDELPASPLPQLSSALLGQHAQAVRHDVALRLGGDDEDVHKLRVALRRSRAYLRVARPLLDADWSERLRTELGWVGGQLGATRDLDVMLAGLRAELELLDEQDQEAFKPLLRRLSGQRTRARSKLAQTLDDRRYQAAVAWLRDAGLAPRATGTAKKLDALAHREVHRLVRRAASVDGTESDQELHRLRIRAKRARYAAELLEGKAALRFVEKATEIQDLLGEHQDATVAEERLRAVVKPTDEAAAVLVAGRLVERQRVRKQRVREELPRRLEQLARRGRALGD
jgi:CHAD domain-containing protein